MIVLTNTPSSPLTTPDGIAWKDIYLRHTVWEKLINYESEPGMPCEWTNHENTTTFQAGCHTDSGIIEYTTMVYIDGDWVDAPFQVIFGIGDGEFGGVEVTIEVHDPYSRRDIARSARFEQWMDAAGVKFRTSHKLEWTGNWEDDCHRFMKVFNGTFDVLSEYGNSEYVRSEEDAQKQRVSEARAIERALQFTFVDTVFAEVNRIYSEFDEGEIVLDVAYGMMVGAIESGGHMVLEAGAVSDLKVLMGDLIRTLEPMVEDAVEGSVEHEEHMASLATVYRFQNWCALAAERHLLIHPAFKCKGGTVFSETAHRFQMQQNLNPEPNRKGGE